MSHVIKSSFEAVFSDFKSNSSLDSLLALFCGFEQALSSAKTTTLMQREPGGCTRDEVRSGRGAPQLGLIGRNDVSGVANARGNLGADREGRAPKKSAVGLDCSAVA